MGFHDRWVPGSTFAPGLPWARRLDLLENFGVRPPRPPSHRAPCLDPGGLGRATSP